MSNEDMRKLMNLFETASTTKKIIKEGMDKFSRDKVMTSQEVAQEFGDELMSEYAEEFNNGRGVYMVNSGSRGYIEGVEFQGKDPAFSFSDYGGGEEGYDDEYDDEDDDYEGDPNDLGDEFTGSYWNGKTMENGITEEESEIYFYWAGK